MKRLQYAILLAAITGLIVAFVLVATGHSSVDNRPNSLGVSQIYTNPYTYLLALPVDGQVLEGKATSIRFKPYAAADLFDISVLFCGDVTEQFDGKTGPLIVTYRIQAGRMYKGVGCHDLVSVFQVKE
jgi:hypothetical protein